MDASAAIDFDVAVVGSGPAGATAALHLARGGARVAIVERETLPRDKTCGGGVVARAWKHWQGVDVAVEHECRAAEANLIDRGLVMRVERATPIVSMVMRSALDRALVDAARAAGAELREGRAVRGLDRRSDRVVLDTDRRTISARFVIAADGALGRTAALAGWTDALESIPALEAELTVPPEIHARFAGTARIDLDGVPRGYGWVFPKRAHLSCGVGVFARGRHQLRDALDRYLARAGVAPVLSIETKGALIPVRPRKRVARERVLLVGDAAGLADPLTAEGISIAAHSASLAARALLDERFEPDRVERAYTIALERDVLRELAWARTLARVLYEHPRVAHRLLAWRGGALTRALVAVVAGERTYRSLLASPRSYLRLVGLRSGRARMRDAREPGTA